MSRAKAKRPVRRRVFVDSEVQGALVMRVVGYWLTCMLAVTLMLLCWQIVTGPTRLFHTHVSRLWFFHGPALVAALVLVPVIMFDMMRLSNRFAGPLFRLRRSMKALADGEPVEPLHFRNNDFWKELADQFNAVAAKVNTAETPAKATHQEPPEQATSGAGA